MNRTEPMNRRHTYTANQGFTLVEFLLYLAISSSVLLLAATFLGTTMEASVKNQTIAEVDQQGLLVMEAVTQTIRNAISIAAPSPGGFASATALVVSDVLSNPTIFSTGGDALLIKKGAAAPVPLTNTNVIVENVSFSNLSSSGSPGTIRVSFTLRRTNVSGRFEYAYTKNFVGSASLRHP